MLKTLKEWQGSKKRLTEYLAPHDIVDDEMVDYFLGVLPPEYNSRGLIQIGEPYDLVGGRETFMTIYRGEDNNFRFAGCCWRGETEDKR